MNPLIDLAPKLIDLWNFVTTRQKYVWKGWCVKDEISKIKK